MENRILFVFAALLLYFSTPILGSKILVICPPPSKSHNILGRGIVETLADRGHEVTFVSPFGKGKKVNYREIVISEMTAKEAFGNIIKTPLQMANMSKIETIRMLTEMQPNWVRIFFSNAGVKKLMTDKSETFDLVIYEYFMNDHASGFGIKFNCPIVVLSPVSLMSWLATMTGNPLMIPTVPNVFTSFSAEMSFFERLINLAVAIIQEAMGKFYIDPQQKGFYEKHFPEESKVVSYEQLRQKISLILLNTHPSVGISRPLLPNAIEVGGYHIGEPGPLPEDLKKIMDNAKHGVIYFSMGSNLNSTELDPEMKKILLDNFGLLKETVLWKYEEDLPNRPHNVIIKNWLPQTSIFAHPNTKLFISHGGLLSCTEATYFGIPLIIMPVFGDQHHNAKTIVKRGQGIELSFDNVTHDSLREALNEALTNKRYLETSKKIQKLFHDRPMKPRDMLGFYVEHVIRTGGAFHLSPPQLSRCSQLLLDVGVILLLPVVFILLLLTYCCRRLCCKKSNKNAPKIKKN